MLLSGTSTRSAPAGRRPPKPSRQVDSFMKKTQGFSAIAFAAKLSVDIIVGGGMPSPMPS